MPGLDSQTGRPRFAIALGNTSLTEQRYADVCKYHLVFPYDVLDLCNSETNSYIVLLTKYDNFMSLDVLEKIANLIQQNPHIGGFYTDSYLKETKQFFPSYTPGMFDKHSSIINTPLFFKASLKPKLNPKVQHLCHYDLIRQISQKAPLYHIAEPLMHSTQQNNFDFKQELALIDKGYT